jgi:aryl-alcohol dehydrogenase-like predicted oxidoreductase
VERFAEQFADDYFRHTTFGVSISSVGLGTYLGETNGGDDVLYQAAVRIAVASGVNLLDTAINYRGQRSERAIGVAVQQMLANREVTRPELVICSKGGYIPLDHTPPASRDAYRDYVKREFIDQQILRPEEIVSGGHSIAPRFLRFCIAKSRQNLGLRTIDVYYLHNPGQQLASISRAELMARLRSAFVMLEDVVSRGEIGVYGVATWDELRVPPDDPRHIALEELVRLAREVAGEGHHFRVVQLPVNLAMPEAVRLPTQLVGNRLLTATDAASELGLTVFGSATLMQAKLAAGLPAGLREQFPNCTTDAQCAIAFAQALPGVTAALIGMRRPEHIAENLATVRS